MVQRSDAPRWTLGKSETRLICVVSVGEESISRSSTDTNVSHIHILCSDLVDETLLYANEISAIVNTMHTSRCAAICIFAKIFDYNLVDKREGKKGKGRDKMIVCFVVKSPVFFNE